MEINGYRDIDSKIYATSLNFNWVEGGLMAKPYLLNRLMRHKTRTHLKNVDQGSGQGRSPAAAG